MSESLILDIFKFACFFHTVFAAYVIFDAYILISFLSLVLLIYLKGYIFNIWS